MSDPPPRMLRSRSQNTGLDLSVPNPNIHDNSSPSPNPETMGREEPPHIGSSSRFVRNPSDNDGSDVDDERSKGKGRGLSPTPSTFEPIDPATFQQSMFTMMQQLTRAIAKQSEVPRQSATPFENKVREPKVNDPEVFDGQPDKLTSFLTECSIVFELQPSRFPNDSTRINYMISFLRKSPLLAIRPHLNDFPRPNFLIDYLEFVDYLRTSYGDPDEQGTARRKYRACIQKGSASSYFSELRQYLAVLGWSEHSEPVVDKAIEGLKPSLKDELARKEDRPSSLSELVKFIVPLDNRLHVREIEKKKETNPTSSNIRQTTVPNTRVTSSTQTTTSSTRVDNAPRTSSSTTNSSTRIELPRGPLSEEEKDRRRKNNLCMYCGQPGHGFLDCPLKRANDQRKEAKVVRVVYDGKEEGNESAGSH